MDELAKQVRRARRRLGTQRFLGVLGWCWFATLTAALVLIAVDKYRPLGPELWVWPVGGLGVGLLAAAVWVFATRRKPIDAAIELDRRFGLKERVSSTLAMPPEDLDTEAGQALVADAQRRVERIDVASRFAVTPGRSFLLPLAPGLAALLVALLVSPAAVDTAAGRSDPPTLKKDFKKTTDAIRRQLAERRKEAEKQGLLDAERLLKKIEEGTRELSPEKSERKKSLVKLNDLSRQLQDRRKQLEGAEQVKQQLDQLKKVPQGPADSFAKAVANGNFQQAAKELQKLKDQLSQGKMNPEDQKKLADQLDKLEDKLKRMADAQKAAEKDLERRLADAKKNGRQSEMDNLQDQLDKLRQQAPHMKQLQDLADKLGQCGKCLKSGKPGDAADALDQLGKGVEDLKKQLDELEMLDGAMDQLSKARDRMNCPKCNGQGCKMCQGGMGEGDEDGNGDPNGPPGNGLGRGRGVGARPEKRTKTSSYDSHVKQKVGEGSARVIDMVDGPSVKGNVEADLRQQFESAKQGSTDPLTGQQLPRTHREHAREYFDKFREGK